DSGMYDATPALAAGLTRAGYRVVETAMPGIGVTSSPRLRAWWGQQARRFDVDLTIAMIGRWDLAWAQAHGVGAYRDLVEQVVGELTRAPHARVEWLTELPGTF